MKFQSDAGTKSLKMEPAGLNNAEQGSRPPSVSAALGNIPLQNLLRSDSAIPLPKVDNKRLFASSNDTSSTGKQPVKFVVDQKLSVL